MTLLSSFSKTYVSLMDSGCSECRLSFANTSFSSWFYTCSNGVSVELDSAGDEKESRKDLEMRRERDFAKEIEKKFRYYEN
ncbi:hypothetical protein Tco_0297071, partial [Tanacetum coccineum]